MISVIVPVFNVEPYLRQCIDSILNQTYSDLEVLLIDDGSPDRCGEICDEYAKRDQRVRVFHTENGGLSAARNLGLSEARGDYIGFVDSDDWIESDMYEILLGRIEETGADISICGIWNVSNDSKKAHVFTEIVYTRTEALELLIDGEINNGVWNKLYCCKLFKNARFPEGMTSEDIFFIQRVIFEADRVAVSSAIGYDYRVRHGSLSKSYSAKNLLDYADTHIDRYCFFRDETYELYKKKQDVLLQYAARGISKVWRWWYGCSSDERKAYQERIRELCVFSKENFPLFGRRSWPGFLRLSTVFMRSNSYFAFFMMYWMNQLFRKIRPERANIPVF